MAGAKTEFRQAQADETWEARRGDRPIFWRLLVLLQRTVRRRDLNVGQGALYALDNLVLELDAEEPRREDLDRLLQELSWVRTSEPTCKPDLYLSVSSDQREFRIPPNCRQVLRTDDFLGFEANDEFYLTDGSSVFHLRPAKGEGYARLAPVIFCQAQADARKLLVFWFAQAPSTAGIYSLHAAGLATRDGVGLLLVGASGSGKSTLAIGLIRQGWRYLSDDAVLLRHGSQRIEALAYRRSFYIDAVRSADYSDFLLGEDAPDSNGGQRRRVGIDLAYPERHVRRCIPHVVIFPQD